MWAPVAPPRILILPGVAGSISRRFCALQNQAPRKLSNGYAGFMSWLASRNDDGDLSAVRIGTSQESGRGLFASRPVRAGERVLEISLDLMIAPSDLPDELSMVLPSTVKPWTKLALIVLMERYKGQSSVWAPYISCLPQPAELDNTFLWEDTELSYLKASPLYGKTRERLEMITTEFGQVQNALNVWPQLFGKVSLEDFKHVYATVFSRSLAIGEDSTLVMIPMLDFFNHNATSFAKLSFNGLLNYAVVTADRAYTENDQIWINYGDLSNAELALDYGFTVPENPYDETDLLTQFPEMNTILKDQLGGNTPGQKPLHGSPVCLEVARRIETHEKSILELNQHSWRSRSRQLLAAAVLDGELRVLKSVKHRLDGTRQA
ncbi:hypothetical protein SELMODRAFT_437298 [Selaginella moellendorffii]|uniref:SET domain-containing protein n=1 Tax=Selaginella moellendorffii TaxID=88036 RepID=D8QPY7_SELML|nr:fructose-bisphosphate aldolase-lysine N-methyltransferase, chloroplastic isoform X1 [Selaginella moellendorffii]EFJ37698.1 hypothetical protein SELMODRAFT_437298 [Selaginella moellendorffii]|eukprot:XP_002960159.1 fructose-bisphosphate aldolase-lysine N-methyltransferase, chloroplastic isoform X1 [Selaginella moellendorffii]